MNATIPKKPPTLVRRPEPSEPAVRLDLAADGIATITFDRPGSSANILDTATLCALARILDDLAARESVRGVVFLSAKPAVFVAGADLRQLAAARNREQLIELGQRTFSKIAALPGVTVAAIHGACVGGGLELSLACDYRIASRDRATRIGLPEVNLGLIPGWGGSTRLPRLVGVPRALRVILGGDLMPAAKAGKLGVVDALAPRERLLDLARKFIGRGKPASRAFPNFVRSFGTPVFAGLARRAVRRKTRGHYPAPLAAIEVVAKALSHSIPHSLAAERDAILKLAGTDVSRNLIRAFFLQDRAKHRPTPQALSVQKTAVIGAGVMGSGIAQWLAARGLDVLLRDVDAKQVAAGLQRADALFAEARRRGLMSAAEARAGMDRLAPSDVPVPMRSVDLVIEAAVERLGAKRTIFADLESRTRPDTILATNTSALPLAEIGRSLEHPQRLVGLHFFNPVHRLPLVEVVRGDRTSDVALDTAVAFVKRVGKMPVVVRDRPGFLVNRILLPYLLEAACLFEEGAPIEALDRSMLDFGMPMGPTRLLDEIGLDVAADVAESLCAAFPDRLRLPGYFTRVLEAGIKGRKSGTGFHEYRKGHAAGINRELLKFQTSTSRAGMTRTELSQRMVLLMINEAARCLEEDVVESPADIDFAMIMGTGFAPFRGGPMRHADALGIGKVTGALRLLADSGERCFTPCERLLEMTANQRRFYDD
jgi:3-hydroxyacyl-CoA dehydrogenase/enoyl-CoA hydratase/3-hydroxybutyryl-CoA epimerase